MTSVIDQHREEVAALCRRAGARRLDVFGSAIRDDFDEASVENPYFRERINAERKSVYAR